MPSKSKAQRNFMAAAAHNPAFAKKVGISTSVAKEFNAADKGKTFNKGGEIMKHEDIKMDKKMAKKAIGMHESQLHGGKKSDLAKLKKGGMAGKHVMPGGKVMKNSAMAKMATGGCVKMAKGGSASKRADGCAQRGKTKGTMV